MEWKRPADAAILGEDARAAKHAAEMSAMLDEWPQKHVKRFKLSCGKAAWLWLTAEGLLTCSAVAPWDDIFAADYVLAETFFANVEWPATWRTKGREGLTKGQRARVKVEREKIYKEWCCGSLGGGRVVLCRVAEVGDTGELIAVQTREDGPSVPVAAHPARKWWPMDKWPLGLRAMWDEERDSVHNYRLFCMMAANAQASADGLPVGRKRKGAVKPPPPVVASKPVVQEDPKDADFRRRMDAKRIELGLPAFADAEWQAFRSAQPKPGPV